MKKLFALSLLFCLPLSSHAISEAYLEQDYNSLILPFYSSAAVGSFKAIDGRRINTYHFSHRTESRKGVIVFTAGQSEAAKKYAELYFDLTGLGYDLYVIDVRAQGSSERLLKNPKVGYVHKFSDYVSDMAQFINQEIPKSEGQLNIVAHSMGAGIATIMLAEHPEVAARVRRAVFSSPMYKINTKPYSLSAAKLLVNFMDSVGLGDNYAMGKKDSNLPTKFETNNLTSSLPRFLTTKELYQKEPEIFIGGPSGHFVKEALLATEHILDLAKKITTPMLIFVGGKDKIVIADTEISFCHLVPNNLCAYSFDPSSQHEFFSEVDEIRTPAIEKLDQFLSQ